MQYRKDIDGLRAVAVGGVVLYHAFPSFLTGGFVGVDVFFVISGFLITAIIASDAEAGRFSITGFYERRFRRILPALAFMLTVTTGAALLILPPSELDQYGRSLVAVAGFASNLLFWRQGGYFDGPAGEKPLLHTWSLAVEEQFYILWPLIAAGLVALGRRGLLKAFVWASVLVSLVASELVVRHSPNEAFYFFPLRAWELGFGALLAVGAVPAFRGQRLRELAGWSGAALILVPMLLYTDLTPFPGLSAVPPCLGTLLLIHAGQGAGTGVGRLLSWRPVLYTGLISYSFYLWHWPVLVLAHIALNRRLSLVEAGLAIATAFALAALSLRYVERPFRARGGVTLNRRALLTCSAGMLAMFAAVGAVTWQTHGFERFAAPAVIAAESATRSVNPFRARCHQEGQLRNLSDPARCTAGSSPVGGYNVLLWGDSHADHLMPGLAGLARAGGFSVRQSSVSGCSPLSILSATSPPCAAYHRATLAEAGQQPRLDAVVISARWSSILPSVAAGRGGSAGEARFRARLLAFLSQLRATVGPRPRIVLIGSTPEFDFWPANCFARAAKVGTDAGRCRAARPNDARWGPIADRLLADVAAPGLVVVLPRADFCPAGPLCRTAVGPIILYRDDDHLTNAGSRFVARGIAPWLGGRPPA